jgi:hypothetical protein
MFSTRLDEGVTPARPRDAMQRPKLVTVFGLSRAAHRGPPDEGEGGERV